MPVLVFPDNDCEYRRAYCAAGSDFPHGYWRQTAAFFDFMSYKLEHEVAAYITDFGRGDFNACGFGLITLRNGNQHNPKYKKVYAEKLLFMRDTMMAPMHFHWFKSEDIINRGGGVLQIKIYQDDGAGGLSDEDVVINADGRSYMAPAGTFVTLHPGESVTLWPHQYHEFHAVPGTGSVLIGEVSQCNDDNTDNRFYEPAGRFPEIEEDEEPYRLLCNEYPPAAD